MSIWQVYRGLSPKARIGVGAGLLLWGVVGLRLSDTAEEKLGYKATEDDAAALDRLTPKITVVERQQQP
ncbi:hypothetical protein B0H63DRAFT_116781 [Podospora didyma]|uniref:Uncharacterized protein n=1 Tax=Podospora didyma TaxID=330526 RepID=A0AAE0NZH9_9PEZI|nr:hypothetical protein B0H63DRAFT_116781 [Podospora didyma]